MKRLFSILLLAVIYPASAQESTHNNIIPSSYELVELGKKVNTPYHESAPIVSPDGK
ncbi:MAG: hypothetical protein M3421_09730 [Bacteroidota bacterium]|nr:hypothetical protein [Bacteroidota bacterium]